MWWAIKERTKCGDKEYTTIHLIKSLKSYRTKATILAVAHVPELKIRCPKCRAAVPIKVRQEEWWQSDIATAPYELFCEKCGEGIAPLRYPCGAWDNIRCGAVDRAECRNSCALEADVEVVTPLGDVSATMVFGEGEFRPPTEIWT